MLAHYLLLFYLFFNRAMSKKGQFAVDCTVDGDIYPDFSNHMRYIWCQAGQPRIKNCPGRFFFDIKSEVCGPKPAIKMAQLNCHPGRGLDVFAVKNNPTYFYLCVFGELKFLLRCRQERGMKSVFRSWSKETIPTCRIPCSEKGNLPAKNHEDFIICNGQFGKVVTCPPGECFDMFNRMCSGNCLKTMGYAPSHGEVVSYLQSPRLEIRPALGWKNPGILIDCLSKNDSFPQPTKCNEYYSCDEKLIPALKTCPNGELYNFRTGKCQLLPRGMSQETFCPVNLCRPGMMEFTTSPQADHLVFFCVGDQVAYVTQCPQMYGLRWYFNKLPEPSCEARCPRKGRLSVKSPRCKGIINCSRKGEKAVWEKSCPWSKSRKGQQNNTHGAKYLDKAF